MELPNVPILSRRHFFRVGAATVSGFYLVPMVRPANVETTENVTPRGSAEFCIFVFLAGAPSQLDTFDIKEGKWTPPDFDIRTIKPGIRMPYALFPNLSAQIEHITISRSMEAWESAHSRAQYYLQVGHQFSPARRNEMPSIGAVVAMELDKRRKASDFLPPFIAMNFGTLLIRQGCLPYEFGPLPIEMKQGTEFLMDDREKQAFERRWKLHRQLEDARECQEPTSEFDALYGSALSMMTAPGLAKVFTIPSVDKVRYGSSTLGDSCVLARNLVQTNAGTRYIAIQQGGWDLHANMYDPKGMNHYKLCHEFDQAVGTLIADLAASKCEDGRTLLDKTLIVCMGEFGRTGGDLTVNQGRDHNRSAFSALFAGGGVKGGRAFGVTDSNGVKVVSPEWDEKRSIYPEDVLITIYSALGINWSKKITNTPSGRAFEYVEHQSGTNYVGFREISSLFV